MALNWLVTSWLMPGCWEDNDDILNVRVDKLLVTGRCREDKPIIWTQHNPALENPPRWIDFLPRDLSKATDAQDQQHSAQLLGGMAGRPPACFKLRKNESTTIGKWVLRLPANTSSNLEQLAVQYLSTIKMHGKHKQPTNCCRSVAGLISCAFWTTSKPLDPSSLTQSNLSKSSGLELHPKCQKAQCLTGTHKPPYFNLGGTP